MAANDMRPAPLPEPTLDHLLNDPTIRLLMDPTIRLLMDRDGVRVDDLTDFLALVRKRLLAERWRHVE